MYSLLTAHIDWFCKCDLYNRKSRLQFSFTPVSMSKFFSPSDNNSAIHLLVLFWNLGKFSAFAISHLTTVIKSKNANNVKNLKINPDAAMSQTGLRIWNKIWCTFQFKIFLPAWQSAEILRLNREPLVNRLLIAMYAG